MKKKLKSTYGDQNIYFESKFIAHYVTLRATELLNTSEYEVNWILGFVWREADTAASEQR